MRRGVPIALLYALPLILLLGALTLGVARGQRWTTPSPLALAPLQAPEATGPACRSLLAALPAELPTSTGPIPRRPLAAPAPAGAMAWGAPTDGGPVVWRCGLPRPAELRPDSELLEVDGVRWLTLPQPDRDTFITTDRPVFAALTVPRGLGSGPVQVVSDAVRSALPAG